MDRLIYLRKGTGDAQEFHTAMDKFFAEQEKTNRSRELRADLWRDHERRISALEESAAQGPR